MSWPFWGALTSLWANATADAVTAIKEAYSSMFAAELVTELEEIRARFPYPKAAMVPVSPAKKTAIGRIVGRMPMALSSP